MRLTHVQEVRSQPPNAVLADLCQQLCDGDAKEKDNNGAVAGLHAGLGYWRDLRGHQNTATRRSLKEALHQQDLNTNDHTAMELVSWYFEPSQPQRVTSWLKTMFNPSPIYSACKSSNHKISINHKISHDTNLPKTQHKHRTQNF